MPSNVTAYVDLDSKVHFVGRTNGQHSVAIDYPPPLGDGDGFTGLEMLLLSLAGCSGTTVVGLLRRMQQPVQGLTVRATGQRRDEHPTILTAIDLEFCVVGKGVDPTAVARAIQMSEAQYCPVWAMLKDATAITSRFQISE